MRPLRSLAVPVAAVAAMALAPVSLAADMATAAPSGFYGGLSLRDVGVEQGVTIGNVASSFSLVTPFQSETGAHASAFGGYRFRNDVSVEASIASNTAGYRLPGRGGVGLMLPGDVEAGVQQWNVDVVGSWSFWRSVSLYGRLGYAQSELAPVYRTSIAGPERRTGEGLEYGVGLRYDFTRALGLKLEYARVGQASEVERSMLPEVDQLRFGVQFRF
jgi:hypothetical protein